MNQPDIGLCVACQHVNIIQNDRGSQFIFCQKSQQDDSFAKYPRLPVIHCNGFVAKPEESNKNEI